MEGWGDSILCQSAAPHRSLPEEYPSAILRRVPIVQERLFGTRRARTASAPRQRAVWPCAADFVGVPLDALPDAVRESEAEWARCGRWQPCVPCMQDPVALEAMYDEMHWQDALLQAWVLHRQACAVPCGPPEPCLAARDADGDCETGAMLQYSQMMLEQMENEQARSHRVASCESAGALGRKGKLDRALEAICDAAGEGWIAGESSPEAECRARWVPPCASTVDLRLLAR